MILIAQLAMHMFNVFISYNYYRFFILVMNHKKCTSMTEISFVQFTSKVSKTSSANLFIDVALLIDA